MAALTAMLDFSSVDCVDGAHKWVIVDLKHFLVWFRCSVGSHGPLF